MTCGKCVARVQESLESAGFKRVSVTLSPPRLTVESDTPVHAREINDALSGTSYKAYEIVHEMHVGVMQRLAHFLPLIVMFALVISFTAVHGWWYDFSLHTLMQYFMAGYFLLFGALKVARWRGFVESYRAYDDLAKRSRFYAWAYPALEIAFGLYYYFIALWWPVDALVALLMAQKAYSTARAVSRGEVVQCACLGSFFAIPVTRVTVFEDALMAAMAVYMVWYALL